MINFNSNTIYYPILENRFSGFIVLRQTGQLPDGETEKYYDDEERDLSAPNPDMHSDLKLPEEFDFDPNI